VQRVHDSGRLGGGEPPCVCVCAGPKEGPLQKFDYYCIVVFLF